jgi:hypothetical protein
MKIELNLDTEEPKYRLVRERDNLIKESARIMWIEFKEDGTFKVKYDEPAIALTLPSHTYLSHRQVYMTFYNPLIINTLKVRT